MVEKLQVFVSSVISSMEADRNVVAKAITSMELEPVVFEMLGAYPENARSISLEKAAECDLFIQLIAETVSPIVVDEYDVAWRSDPGKVLVFVKETRRDATATSHLRSVSQKHKYARYRSSAELHDLVAKSFAAWITRRLRRRPAAQVQSEVVVNSAVSLTYGSTGGFKFDVERGDRVRGLVQSAQYQTFDAWLLDEREYAYWRNRTAAVKPDMHEVITFPIDERARRRETWYVVVKCLAWLDPISVSFHIVRERPI